MGGIQEGPRETMADCEDGDKDYICIRAVTNGVINVNCIKLFLFFVHKYHQILLGQRWVDM